MNKLLLTLFLIPSLALGGLITGGSGGTGDALTTDPLSQFAATTSSQLKGVLSDENAPDGASSKFILALGSLSIASGKTATFSNTLTLAGTDSTTMTFPSTSATIARTDAANTFTGHQTIEGVTSTGATGTGKFVFDNSPTLVTPALGTPASGNLANTTGYPLGWKAGGLTTDTTINNTTTYTTGGLTYAAPDLASGQIYRVTAFGNFTVANSATARNLQVAAFWGSTQLTQTPMTVTPSIGITVGFRVEIILQATSATDIWSTTVLNTALQASGNAQAGTRFMATTSGTTGSLTTSGQSIDLRFNMSTSVAGDAWIIKNVMIERLQ